MPKGDLGPLGSPVNADVGVCISILRAYLFYHLLARS
jgi:hypothetical protein